MFINQTACDLIETVHPSDGLSVNMRGTADIGVKLSSHPTKKCVSYSRIKGIPLT